MTEATAALDGVQVRAAAVERVIEEREDGTGVVEVKIVPYEVEVELEPGYTEVFTRGAFAAAVGNPARVKMSDQQHDRSTYLGKAVELRDTEDGHYGVIEIPSTARGRDLLTLMRAGVLDEVSVEFIPQTKHRIITRRAGGSIHVRHNKATLVGLSPVAAGAYGQNARVLSVREAQANVDRERELAYLHSLTAGLHG